MRTYIYIQIRNNICVIFVINMHKHLPFMNIYYGGKRLIQDIKLFLIIICNNYNK